MTGPSTATRSHKRVKESNVQPGTLLSEGVDGGPSVTTSAEDSGSKKKRRKTTRDKASEDQREASVTGSQEPTGALKKLMDQGIPVAPPGVALPGKERSVPVTAGSITEQDPRTTNGTSIDPTLTDVPQTPSSRHIINPLMETPVISRSTGVLKVVNFEIYSGSGDSSVCHVFNARVPVYSLDTSGSSLEIQTREALQILASVNTPLKSRGGDIFRRDEQKRLFRLGPGPKLLSDDPVRTLEISDNAWLPVRQENGKYYVSLYWDEQDYKKGNTTDTNISHTNVAQANTAPIMIMEDMSDSSPPRSPGTGAIAGSAPLSDAISSGAPVRSPPRNNTAAMPASNAQMTSKAVQASTSPLTADSAVIRWARARFGVPLVGKASKQDTIAEVALHRWRSLQIARDGMEAEGWQKPATKHHYLVGRGEDYTGFLFTSKGLGLIVGVGISTFNSDESAFSKATEIPKLWVNGDTKGDLKPQYAKMMSKAFGSLVTKMWNKQEEEKEKVASSSRNNRNTGNSAPSTSRNNRHAGRSAPSSSRNDSDFGWVMTNAIPTLGFAMYPTVADLAHVIGTYIPPNMSAQQMFYALGTLGLAQVLIHFNRNQRRMPYQPSETGWEKSMKQLVEIAFNPPSELKNAANDEEAQENSDWNGWIPIDRMVITRVGRDLVNLTTLLNWPIGQIRSRFNIYPPVMLITPRLNCHFCDDSPLVRDQEIVVVSVLDENVRWAKGIYVASQCRLCFARFYVDRFTYREPGQDGQPVKRLQGLEYDTPYLCISQKDMIYVHRNVANLQEGAIFRYKSSWSGFADFLNRTLMKNSPSVNAEQMHKLFVEHFVRRLLVTHSQHFDFTCAPNCSAEEMTKRALLSLGQDGGMVPGALDHTCADCTHPKRFQTPEYLRLNQEFERVEDIDNISPLENAPNNDERNEGREWVRLAVMDGKTLSHKICAVEQCRHPLINYQNGRFCAEHITYDKICAIIDCNRNISEEGIGKTCNLWAHQQAHQVFLNRFAHSSFLGVRRGIAKKTTPREFGANDVEEEERESPVRHRFRARRIYCVQTIQWACGTPIAWGKCYDSESLSQVLLLCDSWFPDVTTRPQFLVYDKACKLLSHIITQDSNNPWIQTTRFIVDAFHYINHRANDRLCREHCNPAPTNGSQPDLVRFERDAGGHLHAKRAFNTETAEQFNAWMDGFEAQLRSMKSINFDFFIHVIMLLYKEERATTPVDQET